MSHLAKEDGATVACRHANYQCSKLVTAFCGTAELLHLLLGTLFVCLVDAASPDFASGPR